MLERTDDDGDELGELDREALARALQIASREPDRDEQLKSMLQERSWFEVAKFAAYATQCEALRLKPWRDAPMDADEDEDAVSPRDPDARSLLLRMLAAGLSRYEPDPLAALAKPSRRRRASKAEAK